MEGKRVTAEELKRVLAEDFDLLAEEVAAAMNAARDGRIIADSEEPVRDANAEFRQRMYEKAVRLLQQKQEAFSPSGQEAQEQGKTADDAPDGQRANQDR
jgi:hypothetical protein